MRFFQELQRRKVPRTLLAYGAAAFVAAQVTQLLAEALGIGPWLLRAVVVLEIIALPIIVGLAWALDASRTGVSVTPSDGGSTVPPAFAWRFLAIPVAASVVLLLAAFFILRAPSRSLDQNLIAVLPFHVSGDPQIAYLHEGMIDLLAAKLNGEGGPRAADPRTVLSTARRIVADDAQLSDDAAAKIGRSLGSGQVLVGSVVGTSAQLTIHARILRIPGGRAIVEAEQAGSADSLLTTIDRLVAKLLSLQAGEGSQRLEQLTTTSLPALRAYLEGKAAYRSGHFSRASEAFAKAIDLDSTFAVAAIGQFMTTGWGEGPPVDRDKARRTLITNRDRLSRADRATAVAMYGEDPEVPRSWKRRIADWEAAVTAAPDQLDVLFWYADFVFHWGTVIDIERSAERADEAFQRILRLDSTYVPALLHRIDYAIRVDRPDIIRQLEPLRKQLDPTETAAHYQRARRIRMLGDSLAIAAERAALDTMSFDALVNAASGGGTIPGSIDDAVRAVELRLEKAVTQNDQKDALWDAADRYFMYGMPARADAVLRDLIRLGDTDAQMTRVVAALYWNGESRAGEAAVAELDRTFESSKDIGDRMFNRCTVEHWRLWRGDTRTIERSMRVFHDIPADSLWLKNVANVCLQSTRTIMATVQRSAQLPAQVRALDALMVEGPNIPPMLLNAANIVLARAAEQIGDQQLALRAYGRYPGGNLTSLELSTSMMRERGRLAAITGDRELAIRMYRRYLLLHERAEPSLKSVDDVARRELARLTGERVN